MGSNRTNVSYTLFWLYPFAALVSALKNFNVPKSKNILWLFVVFYGFTFVVSSGELDANRYIDNLKLLHALEVESFSDFAALLYDKETNYVDILQPLLTFLVSRFTDNGRILFAVFGLVFGFFYSRNLWFLFSFVEGGIRKEALFFLILAAAIIPIWLINGFRFWTASHVFIYGFFIFLSGQKIKGVSICLATTLVHFSFILLLFILLIYIVLGNRIVIFSLLYVNSFLFTQISPETFRAISNNLPAIFQERTDRYTSDAYIKTLSKAFEKKPGNWYVSGRLRAINYAVNLLLFYVILRFYKIIKQDRLLLSLFCFSVFMATVVNLLIDLPSMIRFSSVFYVFILSFFFIFFQTKQSNKYFIPLWIKIPFLFAGLLYVIVEIRVGFDTTGFVTVLGNPLIAPLIDDIPLIQLIK